MICYYSIIINNVSSHRDRQTESLKEKLRSEKFEFLYIFLKEIMQYNAKSNRMVGQILLIALKI